nr:MAG TPA: Defensin-1, Scorpion, Centruroides limpidus limpidus [Caudoviricetes sp.]
MEQVLIQRGTSFLLCGVFILEQLFWNCNRHCAKRWR